MGFVHYCTKAPSRERLIRGDVPAWIANSKRSRYIAAIVLSTPPWVNRRELFALHDAAQALARATGVPHSLDHIIPVNHPRVCGLTVPWNLEIRTRAHNLAKGNKWCPEQMEMFDATT